MSKFDKQHSNHQCETRHANRFRELGGFEVKGETFTPTVIGRVFQYLSIYFRTCISRVYSGVTHSKTTITLPSGREGKMGAWCSFSFRTNCTLVRKSRKVRIFNSYPKVFKDPYFQILKIPLLNRINLSL